MSEASLNQPLFELLLRMGDNTLILGHRISEWCGHAPELEEDIAIANIGLDLIGQTQYWLEYAGEVEGKGRSADDLSFLRDGYDFRNVLLVEQPNGDYGQTLMRNFLFDCHHKLLLSELRKSSDSRICEIAEKALKEVSYHKSRSSDLVIGLGDGTAESHDRMQKALDLIWPYAGELFIDHEIDQEITEQGLAPLPSTFRETWRAEVDQVMRQATLTIPDDEFSHQGGKLGRHSEYLGHILTDMQWLQRAYPGATW